MQDSGRYERYGEKSKTSYQNFCHHQKGGDCEQDMFILLSLIWMKKKGYLKEKFQKRKILNQVSSLHKFLDFNDTGS